MRGDYLARLKVRSETYSYIKQLHTTTADAAIHPARTSFLGNSNMPDTSKLMESYKRSADVESLTLL